jgi:hypothetical protein
VFDIRFDEEQRAFQRMAREFAQKEIKPGALDLDSKPKWEDRIPWDNLKKVPSNLRARICSGASPMMRRGDALHCPRRHSNATTTRKLRTALGVSEVQLTDLHPSLQ